MKDSAIIQLISKKLDEHHRALDRHIRRSYKESQSLDSLVREILEGVSSVKELLEGKLEQITEIYNILDEWNDLREKLQNLETSFSPCYEEVVRLRREGKTARHLNISAVEKAWDACTRGPLSQLIEFAKGVKYIGEPLRIEVNGRPSGGERWMIDLVDGQRQINESIRACDSGNLFESISSFNKFIIGHRSFVDAQMRRAIEKVSGLL